MKSITCKPSFWVIGNDQQEFLVKFGKASGGAFFVWGKDPDLAMKWPSSFRKVADSALALLERPDAFVVPLHDLGDQWGVMWPERGMYATN